MENVMMDKDDYEREITDRLHDLAGFLYTLPPDFDRVTLLLVAERLEMIATVARNLANAK